jgi:hypothetical protein
MSMRSRISPYMARLSCQLQTQDFILILLSVIYIKYSNIALDYLGNNERPQHRRSNQCMPNQPRLDHSDPEVLINDFLDLYTRLVQAYPQAIHA